MYKQLSFMRNKIYINTTDFDDDLNVLNRTTYSSEPIIFGKSITDSISDYLSETFKRKPRVISEEDENEEDEDEEDAQSFQDSNENEDKENGVLAVLTALFVDEENDNELITLKTNGNNKEHTLLDQAKAKLQEATEEEKNFNEKIRINEEVNEEEHNRAAEYNEEGNEEEHNGAAEENEEENEEGNEKINEIGNEKSIGINKDHPLLTQIFGMIPSPSESPVQLSEEIEKKLRNTSLQRAQIFWEKYKNLLSNDNAKVEFKRLLGIIANYLLNIPFTTEGGGGGVHPYYRYCNHIRSLIGEENKEYIDDKDPPTTIEALSKYFLYPNVDIEVMIKNLDKYLVSLNNAKKHNGAAEEKGYHNGAEPIVSLDSGIGAEEKGNDTITGGHPELIFHKYDRNEPNTDIMNDAFYDNFEGILTHNLFLTNGVNHQFAAGQGGSNKAISEINQKLFKPELISKNDIKQFKNIYNELKRSNKVLYALINERKYKIDGLTPKDETTTSLYPVGTVVYVENVAPYIRHSNTVPITIKPKIIMPLQQPPLKIANYVVGVFHVNGMAFSHIETPVPTLLEKTKMEKDLFPLVYAYYTYILEQFLKLSEKIACPVIHLASIPGGIYGGTLTHIPFAVAVKDFLYKYRDSCFYIIMDMDESTYDIVIKNNIINHKDYTFVKNLADLSN